MSESGINTDRATINAGATINLRRSVKALVVLVWGGAITLRILDIRSTVADRTASGLIQPTHDVVSPVRVDALDIGMSLVIIAATCILIGRVRSAWLFLSASIVVSQAVTVMADARVGDLTGSHLVATSLAISLLPAASLVTLLCLRQRLDAGPVTGGSQAGSRPLPTPGRR